MASGPFAIESFGFTPPHGGNGTFRTLSSAPEPSSMTLLGLGVGGLLGYGWRRRRVA